LRCRQCLNL